MKEAKLRQLLVLKPALYKQVGDNIELMLLLEAQEKHELPAKKHRYFVVN